MTILRSRIRHLISTCTGVSQRGTPVRDQGWTGTGTARSRCVVAGQIRSGIPPQRGRSHDTKSASATCDVRRRRALGRTTKRPEKVLDATGKATLHAFSRLPDRVKRLLLGARDITNDGNTLDTRAGRQHPRGPLSTERQRRTVAGRRPVGVAPGPVDHRGLRPAARRRTPVRRGAAAAGNAVDYRECGSLIHSFPNFAGASVAAARRLWPRSIPLCARI